jgi:hypothetical protein
LPDSNKKTARNNIGASSATNLLNGSSAFSLRGANANETIGTGSIAFGTAAKASGKYSHALGHYTEASGDHSHAEGIYTTASGDSSHAEGYDTTASGNHSHAEGFDTMASGNHSHAEGYGSVTSITLTGGAGAVEYTTSATNASSYKGCKFIYNGQLFTIINTSGSIVTLDKTLSSTENINTLQLKAYESYASGFASHAEGFNTIASGNSSHAEGLSTIAASGYQHAQGKFNIEDSANKYAHIVGNGSITAPSNAHTLDWNGVGWFKGGLKVGGTSQNDSNAKEVALKSDLDSISFSEATTTTAGLMSADDKTKVDKIATNLVNGGQAGSLRSINSSAESSSYSLGQNAFAVGSSTKAFGNSSHAEGESTLAAGNNSHAEGYNTTASGFTSHAEGYNTKASGNSSHAEGNNTKASGNYSHSEG